MGIVESIIGGSIAQPIEAIGNVLDKVFTNDGEKLDKQIILERLRQQPQMVQSEITKTEAAHRSIFVAGWRPAIGWSCAIGIFYDFVVRPLLIAFGAGNAPSLDSPTLLALVSTLLGSAVLRTFEKTKGISK